MLITRPEADAEATAERVRAAGFDPIVAPLMRIEPRQARLPGKIAALLVTSGNALAALPPGPVTLLAVGDATAARAREAGFSDVRSAGRDARALAALALAEIKPQSGPLLLASGHGQGLALAAELRQAGFRVQRRVCYRAVPARRFPEAAATALREARVHAALFLSGETAAAFVRLLPERLQPLLAPVLAVAIGNAAWDALKPLPWRDIRVAARPNLDELLTLL